MDKYRLRASGPRPLRERANEGGENNDELATTLQNVAHSARHATRPCTVPPGRIRYTNATLGSTSMQHNEQTSCSFNGRRKR